MQKILAIDDKMDNLITLSALLKNLMPGCEVITAQSGREGIEKAQAVLPDVVLLDVRMPDMDGFETCRRLMSEERTRRIPVIMITAIDSDAKTRAIGLDCGANAFLHKPIDRYELISQVKVALRIKNAEDALRKERDSLENKVRERTSALRAEISVRRQAEDELRNSLEALRKAIGATVQVMVAAVETKDPYTAGHQIRVADLSRAIATEMVFPKDKIEGIRLAGSIHDIGKLSIPAEILSKPTKLSETELALIKEHSWKGYEILKHVESPWPLAEIVYQHHERMNGSGYPRNLKGDEILMEARIMAVADVVESMSSYRPYRPALGIEAALKEIEENRGALYDEAVADACLRLFRIKGFKLARPFF
ncbi:MAG: HD domain-containing phosphohydrolase [Thermodesulfobacteriota bacterium]